MVLIFDYAHRKINYSVEIHTEIHHYLQLLMQILMFLINPLFSLSWAYYIICHLLRECMLFCFWHPINAFCFACSYGMRYIAKVLKNSLHEKFPDASEDELMKVEALRCINICFYFFKFTVQYVFAHTESAFLIIVSRLGAVWSYKRFW